VAVQELAPLFEPAAQVSFDAPHVEGPEIVPPFERGQFTSQLIPLDFPLL